MSNKHRNLNTSTKRVDGVNIGENEEMTMASKHKFGRVFDRLDPLVLRPGSGWKNLGSSVYEHTSGVRIHLLGMIRTTSGKHYWLNSCVGGMGWKLIKINGGNRKRGLMAWALNTITQNDQDQRQERR